MKLIALYLLFLLFLFIDAFAGKEKDYRILLHHEILNQSKPNQSIDFAALEQHFIHNEKLVAIIQFNEFPTQQEVEYFKRQGIHLTDYLPHYAYIAEINKSAYSVLKSNKNIRALFPFKENYKLSKEIATKSYPNWMVKGTQLTVEVTIFAFSETVDLIKTLKEKKIDFIYERVEETNRINLRIDESYIPMLKNLSIVKYIEPVQPPAEKEDIPGRNNHRSNAINVSFPSARKYDGTGVKVAMGDDGIIGPHIDYQGRLDQAGLSQNNGNHGDHCAGIIMGAGNLDPRGVGMATGSDLKVYSVWNAVNQSTTHYNTENVRITSTSYSDGCNTGYTSFARSADNHIFTRKSLMHVFSAGNNGTQNCNYGAGAGWGNITGGVKIGKNVIAVANLSASDALASSSSRGPVSDGRIKPDVSAVGTNVWSTIDPYTYASFSGTSMACPGVAGSLAQLYQAYNQIHGQMPYSGLIKGIVMNTADDLGNPGPDYRFGYGRINNLRALQVIEKGHFLIDSVNNGATKSHTIVVPPNTAELRVMVYWTDPQGAVQSLKALVNDINISLSGSNGNFLPWRLDPTPTPAALNTPAWRGIDSLNNQEQITITSPTAGNHTLTVSGFQIAQGPQRYFLTYEFVSNDITVTYPIGGESLIPGETTQIRWDAYGNTGSFTVQFSSNGGQSYTTIATIGGAQRFANWNVPSTFTSQGKIRISRNNITDESDQNFHIMTRPTGITVQWACPDSIGLTWNVDPNAAQYEVRRLGVKYMDSVGVNNQNFMVIKNINGALEHWFTVRSIHQNGAISERQIAVQKQAGTFGCVLGNDMSLRRVINPTSDFSSCGSSSFPIKVLVRNTSLDVINTYSIGYILNGANPVIQNATVPVNANDSAVVTLNSNLNPAPNTINTLKIWVNALNDNNKANDTAIVNFRFNVNQAFTLPHLENFDSQTNCATISNCGQASCTISGDWKNNTNNTFDQIDWRVNSGPTPSSFTGPSVDFNLGTIQGKYVYLEANACNFNTAYLNSPCIDLNNTFQPRFRFNYHMNGNNMGRLHVDVFAGGTWIEDIVSPISGNQGNSWKTQIINLNPYKDQIISIRFRGVTGTGENSDIALDALNFYDDDAPQPNIATEGKYCVNVPITFSATATGQNNQYSWNFGNDATPQTAIGPGPHSVSFSTIGAKTVVVNAVNQAGPGSNTLNINIIGNPTAGFNVQPIASGFSFLNSSVSATSYLWNFGDGGTSSQLSPFYSYSTPGTYQVQLTAFNDCGEDSTSREVVYQTNSISDNASLEINIYPNPNNGKFIISGELINSSSIYVSIIDLSGKEILQRRLITGQNTEINLENKISSGVYFVKIENDKIMQTQKLIVR